MAGESMQSLGLLEAENNVVPDIQIDPSLTAEATTDTYATLSVFLIY